MNFVLDIVLTGYPCAECQTPKIQPMLLLKYLVVISLRLMHSKPSFNALVLEKARESHH